MKTKTFILRHYLSILLILFLILLNSRLFAQLPHTYGYQDTLYNWLEAITISNVTLPNTTIQWDGTYADSNELADLYLETISMSNSRVVRGEPDWYVLDAGNGKGIEATGTVRIYHTPEDGYGNPPRSWENEAAYLYQLHIPIAGGGEGNGFYHVNALGLRALIVSAVDMMMYQEEIDAGTSLGWTDMFGRAMLGMAESYRRCKDVLPDSVQVAFESGFERFVDRIISQGARNANTNLDMFVIQALANVYMGANSETLKTKALQAAKRMLLGFTDGEVGTHHAVLGGQPSDSGVFYPAGYISESDAPEAYYNGESIYHLLGAYTVVLNRSTNTIPSDWDFLKEILTREARWKVYQYFPEPAGGTWDINVSGTGFSGRTSAEVFGDQASSPTILPWRDLSFAALFPEARRFTYRTLNHIDLFKTESEMVSSIQDEVASPEYGAAWDETYVGTAPGWGGWSPWVKLTTYLPQSDWYTYLEPFIQSNDTSIQNPVDRGVNFNKAFGGEPTGTQFWAYKNSNNGTDFGFYIEAVARQGTAYKGWYGGKLETFWTRPTGTVIINRHGKSATVGSGSQDWADVERYPGTHVWGVASNDNHFTTLFIRGYDLTREVIDSTATGTPFLEVVNYFNDTGIAGTADVANSGEETGNELVGDVAVTNKYQAVFNGVQVTQTVTSDETDQIKELWATIPIYLRNNYLQQNLSKTTIEYWDGTGWSTLTTTLTGTDALRLGRDFGSGAQYAYVSFAGTNSIKLAPQEFEDTYQTNTLARAVHIALIDNEGTQQTLPASTAVTYTVQTTNPIIAPADNRRFFQSPNGQYELMLESENGSLLSDYGSAEASQNPESFPFGIIGFTLSQIDEGATTTIDLTLPPSSPQITGYWKFGVTPDDTTHHWYEFPFNGQTGAEIDGNVIHLHITDGGFGDDDLTANGVIVDDGGPVVLSK